MRKSLAALSIIAASMLATNAAEAAGERDLQLIGRALSFVEGGATGNVTLAIVYADDVAGSQAEAEGISAIVGSGLNAGQVTLQPQLVSVSEIGGLGAGTAIFVPAGMSAHYSEISSSSAITVSTDRACAEAGACVVAVQSDPSVEIFVSRSAADARSVSFASAFRMMINEL
ncbi:hypothetical protein [Ponticaulis sp.]|uniref:hypothetical protein n=1 Tax=Ponticaulis sp. TaxID=2020902 RepID=UPI000B66415E|nr:hypothetical protein [Ponticaulis sp.]RPG17368.1 MAG: hypothetical protein CBC85_005230 [Hyphomonadaceae bacterium TMED125]HBH88703.1 hypothetical protein [Hyphomonadaceae bacterium]MAJ08662.1 hypothetical protein [Ponticaulis sp.]MAJ09950.1 hypothetical protein [Ponticaulis sp.]RPG18559.1 MAG: hypothetical protein CBC85_002245 [Hyphomonadaceae bacterium TMED125]|tara:strand:- start:5284 stop:5799 length:516 start_codon:yes stop_codon:yes gene_type:complete